MWTTRIAQEAATYLSFTETLGLKTFVLPGEKQTTADIVKEFAKDHELWDRDFLEGWQVPSSLKFIRPLFPDRQLLFMLSVSS